MNEKTEPPSGGWATQIRPPCPSTNRLAMANPNVQKFVAGQNVKKVVVVPGRLVNLVV